MNINEIVKTVLAVIGALGGAAVIVGGLAAWLGKVWADRLFLKESAKYQKEIEDFKNQYTTELEHLRADITERRDLLNNTLSALSSGYAASHERIVTSMEDLWKTILDIEEFVSPQVFFYQILLPQEYNNLPADKLNSTIPVKSRKELDTHMLKVGQSMEDKRIFIGEKLWLLFYVYRAFAYRLVLKVADQRANGKLYEWNEDNDGKRDYMEGLLLLIFSKEDLDKIINPPTIGQAAQLGVPQRIMRTLEVEILNEMNEWLFGKRLINMSIEEQQRVNNLLRSAQSLNNNRQV